MPMLDLNLGLKGSQCIFRIRPARKPDMWVYIIDRGDGSLAKAGEVGSEAALVLKAELLAEAEKLRRLGWQDVMA